MRGEYPLLPNFQRILQTPPVRHEEGLFQSTPLLFRVRAWRKARRSGWDGVGLQQAF